MTWVEVESEPGAEVMVAGCLGLSAGVLVWWLADLWSGLLAYFCVGGGIILARGLWLMALLPRDTRSAALRVLAWFREAFPNERIEGVAVRAVEANRFIISVRYGFGNSASRKYFAVNREGPEVIQECPSADWWPRGLK